MNPTRTSGGRALRAPCSAGMSVGLTNAAANWTSYGRSGVVFTGSQVRKDDITDGVTNTYLLGEKYLNPSNYTNGTDLSDSNCMYSGSAVNNQRSTMDSPPVQDRGYPAGSLGVLLFRRPPRQQLLLRFLRRLGPLDQLFDQSGRSS